MNPSPSQLSPEHERIHQANLETIRAACHRHDKELKTHALDLKPKRGTKFKKFLLHFLPQ